MLNQLAEAQIRPKMAINHTHSQCVLGRAWRAGGSARKRTQAKYYFAHVSPGAGGGETQARVSVAKVLRIVKAVGLYSQIHPKLSSLYSKWR